MVGAGGIAAHHLPVYEAFPDRLRLVAICDAERKRASELASHADSPAVYSSVERMLAEAAIDAVDICTTHDQHAPIAIAAANAGLHVLVEKPMACSIKECKAMVAAAERAGVILMVAQNHRYLPVVRGTKAIIDAGQIGRVRAVRCDSMQNLSAYASRGHWLYDGRVAGGGIVISVSVHKIDLLRYLVGEVTRVTAMCRNTDSAFLNGAEDYAVALLEFENGAIGQVFATYSGVRVPWFEQFTIFAEHGTIHGGPFGEPETAVMVASTPPLSRVPETWADQVNGFTPVSPCTDLPSENSFVNEILHFADCCAHAQEPLTSGRDNLNTMKVVFAIYESSRIDQPVETALL